MRPTLGGRVGGVAWARCARLVGGSAVAGSVLVSACLGPTSVMAQPAGEGFMHVCPPWGDDPADEPGWTQHTAREEAVFGSALRLDREFADAIEVAARTVALR